MAHKKSNYFNDDIQNNYVADFGFDAPHRRKTSCKNPVFADHTLHRIAIMKEEHFGSKGDRDENGLSGWVAKRVCTGCGKIFKGGGFYPDKTFFK